MAKKRLTVVLLSLIGLFIFTQLNCQSPETVGRLEGALKLHRIRAHLQYLSDDLMEGRGTGSRGSELAAKYIASQFQTAGLIPAVGDSSYFQNVELLGMIPTASLTIRGPSKTWKLKQGSQFVGWTEIEQANVSFKDLDVIFMGFGIVAPEYNWNDYTNIDVTGKVLMMFVNEPQTADSLLFGGRALTYYGRWTYKFEEAIRKGAEAVILIHTTPLAGYGWNVVQNSWTGKQFYIKSPEDTKFLKFESWITQDVAQEVLQAAGLSLDNLIDQASSSDFKPITLPLKVTASVQNEILHIQSPNVIAKLEGSDPQLKEECIIYTSHYDHLGKNESESGDNIFNGAYDNASGTAALIEIAQAFTRLSNPPKRTVLFAAVTAEESGLLGSQYYAQHPIYSLAKTAANINIDAVNVWGRTENIIAMGADRSTISKVVQKVADEMHMEISPDPMPEQGFFYRSDQFSLVKVGVPAVYFDAGLKFVGKPADWGKKLMEEYIEKRYHSVEDEYDPSWSLEGTVQVSKFALKTGLYLANAPTMPEWNEGDQFKRIREQSIQKFSKK
ncbi:MAG: M20/M25/M40 family metallo-hydrolase [bacterium]